MKRILIALTRVYQKTLSKILPSSCRFYPSCSQYAIEALEMHGAFRGSVLACWRILRCNPFGSCGGDPVPKRFWGHDAVSKEQDEL